MALVVLHHSWGSASDKWAGLPDQLGSESVETFDDTGVPTAQPEPAFTAHIDKLRELLSNPKLPEHPIRHETVLRFVEHLRSLFVDTDPDELDVLGRGYF
jgi:hypothetical protein